MEEQLTKTTRPAAPAFMRLFNVFIASMVALLLTLLVIEAAASEDHPLCRAMASTMVSGRLAEWDASIDAWKDMPADLGSVPIDLLPVPDDSERGFTAAYYLMFSPSTMQLWVIPYRSLTFVGDGTHDACPALIYDLNPEHR